MLGKTRTQAGVLSVWRKTPAGGGWTQEKHYDALSAETYNRRRRRAATNALEKQQSMNQADVLCTVDEIQSMEMMLADDSF